MTTVGPSIPAQAPAHVRAILTSTRETLGLLFDAEPDFAEGRLCPAASPRGAEVNVIVSFTGAVQGHVLLGMTKRTACAMAASLLMEEITEFDDMTRSGVAEIANIVAGGCATALHRDGFETNITVPSVIAGDRVEVSWPNLFIIETALTLPAGEVRMAVGLKVSAA